MSIAAINARNQFHGAITAIIHGPVVSKVDVETPFGIVTSVITTRSVKVLLNLLSARRFLRWSRPPRFRSPSSDVDCPVAI